jgi:integrase
MPKSTMRVLGPYKNGTKWRLVVFEGGNRKSLVLDSHEQAIKAQQDLQTALKARIAISLELCLGEYTQHQRERGVQSAEVADAMLRRFLPLDEPISALTAERAQKMYLEETKRKKENGHPISSDTHHLLLRRLKQFYRFAVSRRHTTVNPFAEVRPLGKPHRGKVQFRIDEARRFVKVALEHAEKLEVGATAALMQIFLGLRPTEAVIRVVRDLDDEGRVLWIPFGKTDNARRRLQVPETLRNVLIKHAQGKSPDAPLLGPLGEPPHKRFVLRYQLSKLCEEAGLPQVCPHSLRGLNATLAMEAGATAHHVAAALGHSSFVTTARHYADASTVANASLRKVVDVLTNGSDEGPDLDALASKLRAQLSSNELKQLRQLLFAEPKAATSVRRHNVE